MDFTFLPNSRWLCLSSDDFGRDWLEKSWQIDDYVESLGLDHIQEDRYDRGRSLPLDVFLRAPNTDNDVSDDDESVSSS